jgi:hypothetical protein
VRTIDEGIEVLTGVKAGERLPDSSFEADTVNARVDQRLRGMAEALQRFGKEEGHKHQESDNANDAG